MQEEVRGLLHRDEGAEGNARVLKGEVASLSAALLRKEDQLSLQAGELHELGTTSATLVSVHQELKGLQKSFQVTSRACSTHLLPCFVSNFAVGVQSASLLMFAPVVSIRQACHGDLHASWHCAC